MVLKNLKLYIENITILEENEKLRKKASLLHQENLELMSEIQKKFAPSDRVSTTLDLLLHNKENQLKLTAPFFFALIFLLLVSAF